MVSKVKSICTNGRLDKTKKHEKRINKVNNKTKSDKIKKLKAYCKKQRKNIAVLNTDQKLNKQYTNKKKSDTTSCKLNVVQEKIDFTKKKKQTEKNKTVTKIINNQSEHNNFNKAKKLKMNHKIAILSDTTDLKVDLKQKESPLNVKVATTQLQITNQCDTNSQLSNNSKTEISQNLAVCQTKSEFIKTAADIKVEVKNQVTNGGLTDCSESSESQTVAIVQISKTEKATVDVLSETATLGVAIGQVEASSKVTAASCGIITKSRVPKRRAFRVVNVIGFDEPSTEFVFPMLQRRTNKNNTPKSTYSTDASSKEVAIVHEDFLKESGNKQSIVRVVENKKQNKIDKILEILDRTIGTTVKMLKLLGEDS